MSRYYPTHGMKESVKKGELSVEEAIVIAKRDWDWQPAIDKFVAWAKQYRGGSQPATEESDGEGEA